MPKSYGMYSDLVSFKSLLVCLKVLFELADSHACMRFLLVLISQTCILIKFVKDSQDSSVKACDVVRRENDFCPCAVTPLVVDLNVQKSLKMVNNEREFSDSTFKH